MSFGGVMLLSNYVMGSSSMGGTVYVSIKYDGWRMLWFPNVLLPRGGIFVTRSGIEFDAPMLMYSECKLLSPCDILDGEFWCGYGTTSSDVSNTSSNFNLRYMVFDVPNFVGDYESRYNYLSK